MRKVVIISGGGFQGLPIIRELSPLPDIRLILVDCYQQSIGHYLVAKHYQAPRLNRKQQFLDFLRRVIKLEGVDLIFPCTNHELELLARHKLEIEESGTKLALSDITLLRHLGHKSRLQRFLQEHGLPIVPSVELKEGCHLPLIGKPNDGWGGRGIMVLRNRADLHKLDRSVVGNYLWQHYLEAFEEFSVDFAIAFSHLPSKLCIRKRLRTSGGFATVCEDSEDSVVRDLSTRLLHALVNAGAVGIFNTQLLKTRDGYFVSDVNPRPGTSSTFARGMNVPLASFIYRDLFSLEHSVRRGLLSSSHGPTRMFRVLDEKWVRPASSGIRGIVFDLDDTLVNHKQWMYDKLQLLWYAHRGKLPDRREFLEFLLLQIEEGNRSHVFDTFCSMYGYDTSFKSALIETYREMQPQTCVLYSDVEKNLDELKRRSIKLGILTDNPPKSQRQKLMRSSLLNYVDHVTFSQEYGCEKPTPFLFQKIAEELSLTSPETAMVGDNLYRDVRGALASGYGDAFLIKREGGLFNFNAEIAEDFSTPTESYTRLESLDELLWYIEEPRKAFVHESI